MWGALQPFFSFILEGGGILHNGRAYETFCWSLAEAKCGEARRSNATELIGFDISMKAIPELNIFRDEVMTTIPILIQGGLHEYRSNNKVRLRN